MNLGPVIQRCSAAAAVVVSLSGCAAGWNPYAASESRNLSLSWQQSQGLLVHTRNGSVDVSVDPLLSEVKVAAKVQASGDTQEEADARVKLIKVVTHYQPDGQLEIYPTIPDDAWRGNDGCSLTITLPKPLSVNAQSSNGSIRLAGMTGPARAKTSNGSVTVTGQQGPVTVDTTNGSVRVSGATGDVYIKTSNGPVEVVDFARSVDVDTSNGNVVCRSQIDQCGPVALRTSNGGVSLDVGPTFVGSLTAVTSNGHISAEGPALSVSGDKTSKTIRFSNTGPDSIIRTSNGVVSVSVKP